QPRGLAGPDQRQGRHVPVGGQRDVHRDRTVEDETRVLAVLGDQRQPGRDAAGRPASSIATGLSLVTEDRKDTGLVLNSSIAMNIALSAYRHMTTLSLIRAGQAARL